jgi:hypothetical protein
MPLLPGEPTRTRGVPPREELTAAAYLELKRLREELDSARQAYEDSAD